MTTHVDRRLEELGITLPQAAAPVAAYVPAVLANGLLHVSGQLPFRDARVVTGRLGDDVDVVGGQAAARLCGLMLLAQVQAAVGLDRVERVVRLGVFVNSTDGFDQQPEVANGASELMQDVFGEAGRHARAAVGVPALPRGAVVEVDAVFAVRG